MSVNPPSPPNGTPLAPGDWVEVAGMKRVGRIESVDMRKRRARVTFEDTGWTIELKKLRRIDPPAQSTREEPLRVRMVGGGSPLRHEIDLHGMRVEEALEATDRALDQAVVAGLDSFKVIHGHGTGRVRTAVRDLLTHHHHVSAYRFGGPAEGGLACTIVELKRVR